MNPARHPAIAYIFESEQISTVHSRSGDPAGVWATTSSRLCCCSSTPKPA